MYAIDETALHRTVRKHGRDLGNMVNVFEIVMIVVALFVAVRTAKDPVLYGVDYHEFVWVGLFLLVAGYLIVGRLRRRARNTGFEPTLRGDLGKAIAHLDYQIGRHRSFIWWFILPAVLGSVVSFAFNHANKPMWVWAMLPVSWLAGWCIVWLCTRPLLSKKRELEGLRAKLDTDAV